MKNILLGFSLLLTQLIIAQSGSVVADRIPSAYHYKGENCELHVLADNSSISGYFIQDGKVDSIKFGSFLNKDIAIYLKSGIQLEGKTKSFDKLSLKIVNSDFKKIGKLELNSTNKDKILNMKAEDQSKYTEESGLAIYMLDDKHFEFAVFWEEKASVNSTNGVFKFYSGVAEKRGVGSVYKYEEYVDADNPALNTSVFIELKDGKANLWIDSELSSMMGGLKKDEKISFTK